MYMATILPVRRRRESEGRDRQVFSTLFSTLSYNRERGCKQRGFRGQRAFDHTTGQGYVKSQRGHYHDGIFTKRNKFNLLLHETFGGGFSPPAVAKINRLARKAQRSGVDRTAYPPHSRLSFVSHHAERISIASVKGVNRAILDRRAKLASELSRSLGLELYLWGLYREHTHALLP